MRRAYIIDIGLASLMQDSNRGFALTYHRQGGGALKMQDGQILRGLENTGLENDGPLFASAVVRLLTWLCVCTVYVYLANYRRTLVELD